jgi:hypothetical protein
MPAFVDITGHVYGRLTVLKLSGRIAGRHAWLCRCLCGKEVRVASHCLRTGNSRSCGCLNNEVRSASAKKRNELHAAEYSRKQVIHGHTVGHVRTKTYNSWMAMKERCDRPVRRNSYCVGIKICDRWRDFNNFLSDMGESPPGATLDRINPFGNYEPANCRWADKHTQRMNTRARWKMNGASA